MSKELNVAFISQKLKENFELLSKGKFQDKGLYKFINKAIDNLKDNPTCSLTPSSATITSGSSQTYTITKSDPNGDTVNVNCPITLSNGITFSGTCSGTMSSFTVISSTPGTYTNGITVSVNDGRGGTGTCSSSLTVNACGGVGQACCAGSTCSGTNVCASGTCYQACTLNSASIAPSTGCSGSICQKTDTVLLSSKYI